jgi:hypothetical protein
MNKIIFLNLVVICLVIPLSSAAHYVVGIVENAKDGTSANGHTVFLWNPTQGTNDNLTDIIGISGNSRTSNIYMIDCELLNSGCNISSVLNLKVINNGDNYISNTKNVTITGAGFDIVENITLNSPPLIENVFVEDSFTLVPNEIDLVPAVTKEITCKSIINEYDGENSIINASAMFFDNSISYYSESDDNNKHYSNQSCIINYSYGNSNQVEALCTFNVWYYANSQNWNCSVNITDNFSVSSYGNDLTFVNPLLALGVNSSVNFGEFGAEEITEERQLEVINYGNVRINLSLSGYGFKENDGNAMNCTLGSAKNISLIHEKYNLTNSNSGELVLAEFIASYDNLTSAPKVKKFNLNYRTNDFTNEAIKPTYWRIYVPAGVAGECQGNIIFGAVQSNEI